MQIHGVANVNVGVAMSSAPKVTAAAASVAKSVQPVAKDQVTLSQAAKNMANNSGASTSAAANSINMMSVENSINSGNYTIIGTALSGHLVTLLIE